MVMSRRLRPPCSFPRRTSSSRGSSGDGWSSTIPTAAGGSPVGASTDLTRSGGSPSRGGRLCEGGSGTGEISRMPRRRRRFVFSRRYADDHPRYASSRRYSSTRSVTSTSWRCTSSAAATGSSRRTWRRRPAAVRRSRSASERMEAPTSPTAQVRDHGRLSKPRIRGVGWFGSHSAATGDAYARSQTRRISGVGSGRDGASRAARRNRTRRTGRPGCSSAGSASASRSLFRAVQRRRPYRSTCTRRESRPWLLSKPPEGRTTVHRRSEPR
jgi:hypothetical protein